MSVSTPGAAPIFLVSERFGSSAGGEAIKGQQFADELLSSGDEVVVFTHERSTRSLGGRFPEKNLRVVADSQLQRVLWAIRPLRPLLSIYFHLRVRALIESESGGRAIVHYISPVSPVQLRFPPKHHYVVMGPLTGNIYYPPGFRGRMSLADRLKEQWHAAAQLVLGRVFGEKRRANAVLVSGYERTRESLRLAGCSDEKMLDVVDAGVSAAILARPRITHSGENTRFVCSGRLVDHKGIDLAIRATAIADSDITLDIYGDGEKRQELEQLVRSLGLTARVRFMGWMERHEDLLDAYQHYRAHLFPSLAEANGIAMQESMTAGLPVIALRWGGPAMLADDLSAVYLDASKEDQVISDMAQAMNRLARNGDYADDISRRARDRADLHFAWPSVLASWRRAYDGYFEGAEETSRLVQRNSRAIQR